MSGLHTNAKYDGSVDLGWVLEEILRNVEEAQATLAKSPQDYTRLTAGLVDNLRCIVEDADERLRPHLEALDKLWDWHLESQAAHLESMKKLPAPAPKSKK
jgi:hypothetical protein